MTRVVCGLIRRDGRLLMTLRRSNSEFGGFWEFPGGKVEDGETQSEALSRELMEELGVSAIIGDIVTDQAFPDAIPRSFSVTHRWVELTDDAVVLPLASDEARWVTLAEADILPCVPSAAAPLEAARRLQWNRSVPRSEK